jgi:hypothetical protein
MQEQVNQQTRILDEARASGQTLETEINDLATMQDDIRRLGESWFERMRKQQAAPGSKDGSGVPVTPGFPWQEASVPATPTTGDAQPPKAPEASSKTLDELLGITPPAPPTDTADRRRERKLDSALQEKDLGDLATVAQESLALVDELVGDRRDTGLETQRAQAEALAFAALDVAAPTVLAVTGPGGEAFVPVAGGLARARVRLGAAEVGGSIVVEAAGEIRARVGQLGRVA